MDMKRWITSLPGSPLPTQAAEKAGIDRGTLSRQLARNAISANNVIKIARAYNSPPVEALVNTGYLDRSDMQGLGIGEALRNATNRQLLDEVMNRSDPEGKLLLRGGDGAITPQGKAVPVDAVSLADDVKAARFGAHRDRFEREIQNRDHRPG